MIGNERGGRKEATGIWGWKLETLEPGENAVIEYSLSNLEKGDWTETDVFFRGTQDVIGATKLDEKMLKEIRNQEQMLSNSDDDSENENSDGPSEQDKPEIIEKIDDAPKETKSTQTTLFGGDE